MSILSENEALAAKNRELTAQLAEIIAKQVHCHESQQLREPGRAGAP